MRAAQPKWHARARAQAGPHQPVPVPLLDRTGVLMNVWLFLIALSIACQAEIIDRIAVTVGSSVITESEIVREIRLTSFLNDERADFSAVAKRKTADRLVEQRLIQMENDASLYPPPSQESVDEALKEVQSRIP